MQVSGSATITTGEVGENFSADANFQGGNINISFAGGAAGEIFGVQFSAMLTLPTGAVVSALRNIGANVGSTVAAGASAAAQAVAAEAMSISNTVQNAALSFGNEFEDIGDAIGSIY